MTEESALAAPCVGSAGTRHRSLFWYQVVESVTWYFASRSRCTLNMSSGYRR